MAGFDGALVIVSVTDDAGAWLPIAAQQSFSHETSRNMLEGSVKGDVHSTSAYGRQESTATLEGLVSFSDGGQQRLEDALNDREEVTLRMRVGPQANGTYNPATNLGNAWIYEAKALVASISRSFPDNENSSYSAEFNMNERFARKADVVGVAS